MKTSRNEQELRHIWTEWHNKCGNRIRNNYEQFVKLSNQAARLNSWVNILNFLKREDLQLNVVLNWQILAILVRFGSGNMNRRQLKRILEIYTKH